MKKIILSILTTFVFTLSVNSQVKTTSTTGLKQVYLEIPTACRSSFKVLDKDSGATTFEKYSNKYKVNVTFVVDKLKKVISCSIPVDSVDPLVLGNIAGPSNGCVGDCGGTWACFWACFWDNIG